MILNKASVPYRPGYATVPEAEIAKLAIITPEAIANIHAPNSDDQDILIEGTPVNAVAATGTLTLTDVATDDETVTIGTDVYEFAADAAQTVTSGNIAVDITSYTTASSGTLTVDTQPTSGDTMTIGTKEYTFVPDGTANADGKISIGTDLPTAQAAIVAAINGTDSVNTAHPLVSASAFAANDCTITALIGGTAGDTIATTETFSAESNVFAAVVLGSGADCSAANAVTALVAADAGTDYTLADGAGDTVTVTADTKGVVGNAIDTLTDMANASFAEATLTGGVDGTVSEAWIPQVDASFLYIPVAANTIADANWRRIDLGSAY
jgi:hypothetical protein